MGSPLVISKRVSGALVTPGPAVTRVSLDSLALRVLPAPERPGQERYLRQDMSALRASPVLQGAPVRGAVVEAVGKGRLLVTGLAGVVAVPVDAVEAAV
jgi:hypothetical protein